MASLAHLHRPRKGRALERAYLGSGITGSLSKLKRLPWKKSFDSISTYAHIVCVFFVITHIYIYYAGCPLPQKHHPRFRPFGPRASPLTQNMRLYPSQHDRLDATTPWLLLLSLCRRIQFTSSAYSFNQVYTPRPGHGRARLIHRESKNTRHLTFAHNFTKYWPIFKILSLLDSVGNL